MKSMVFKRILLCISVCTLLLLLGCGQTPPLSDSTPATTEPQPPATTEELSAEPIEQVKAQLNDYLNFRLSMEYMEPMRYSTFQETDMLYAADGSYRMTNSRKNTHGTQETEETAEFYYRYESDEFVCYMRVGDAAFSRAVMTVADLQAMEATRPLLVGAPALLPDYLQDLTLTETEDSLIFTYQLPLEEVLDDNTMLATFVGNVFNLSGAKYDESQHLTIGCTLEVAPETYCPRSLTYDFEQVKPLVLTDGAFSFEYALQTDLMTMSYSFDDDHPATVTIPEATLKSAPA